MLTEILLIRHGEAFNNIPQEGLDYGKHHHANPPLTELGCRQAEELKHVLTDFRPDVVVVSPFHRTIQTARPYVSPGVKVVVDRRMGERVFASHFKDFPGIDPADYEHYGTQLMPDALCLNRSSFPEFPETRESVRERVSSLFEEWNKTEATRMAFIGHGASLAGFLNFLVPEYPNNTGHGNCGYSHLQKTAEGWKALVVNEQKHLTRTNGQLVN